MGYNLRATRDESPALCIVESFSLQSSDFSCWFSERALRWKGFPDRDNLCVACGIASLNHRKGMNVREVSGRNHQSCSVMIPYRETMTGRMLSVGFAALNPRQFIDFSYGKFGGREAVALPGDPTATRSEPSDS